MGLLKLLINNPQLIVVAIVIIAPVFKAILKAINEAKAERERKRVAEQAKLESLRTGRPVDAAAPAMSGDSALRAANAQSARLELEQRAASRRVATDRPAPNQRMQASGPVARPPTEQPQSGSVETVKLRLPGGMVIELPKAEAPSPAPQNQAPRPPTRQKARGNQRPTPRAPEPKPRPDAPTDRAPRVTVMEEQARVAEAALQKSQPKAPADRPPRRMLDVSAGQLRSSIILGEILGPPPGLK